MRPGVELGERRPVGGQEVRLGLRAQHGLAEVVGELLVGADRVVGRPVDRDLLGLEAEVDRGGVDDQRAEAVADDGERRVPGRGCAISPDGSQGFVPTKQDNVKRGALRDGTPLNFQSTVRAVSSRIDLAARASKIWQPVIALDNASLASAALFDPHGVYLFVALETSREVAVIDAPLAFAADALRRGPCAAGTRTVRRWPESSQQLHGSHGRRGTNLKPLIDRGQAERAVVATVSPVATDKLSAQVLLGKRFSTTLATRGSPVIAT